MNWQSFLLGAGAFAALSLVINLFDADFREAFSRVVMGLIAAPFFLLALAWDRFFPSARRVNSNTLARFASYNRRAQGWVFAYRNNGILIIRQGSKEPPAPARRAAPVVVRSAGK